MNRYLNLFLVPFDLSYGIIGEKFVFRKNIFINVSTFMIPNFLVSCVTFLDKHFFC